VYVPPGSSPVIVQEVKVVVHALPPGAATARYPEIGWPPSSEGACQVTVAESVDAAVAATETGGSGTPCGVTGDDDPLAGPSPASLRAVTLNVYDCPLTRPGTVQVRGSGVTSG